MWRARPETVYPLSLLPMTYSPHRQTVGQFMSDVDVALADIRESIRLQASELDRQAKPDGWRRTESHKRDIASEFDRLRNLYRFVAEGKSYGELARRPGLSVEEVESQRLTVISQVKRAAAYLGVDLPQRR
jgi:hypothetical protein